MKHLLASLFSLAYAFSSVLMAECSLPQDYSFYIKVDSGVSFSKSVNISAGYPPWIPAEQGYNSTLGNCAIGSLALGCEICHLFNLDVSISNRSHFKYRKFQTPEGGGNSYTRKFDLDVTPILFSFTFLGRNFPCLNWDIANGSIYPIVGAGIGSSNLLITNYRTTGLLPTGGSFPYASFSAENEYTLRKNFTYTAFIGLEYHCNDRWALSSGYRWFDAGTFKGPRYQRVGDGSAVDVNGHEWKMDFKAHEWFIELKIFI